MAAATSDTMITVTWEAPASNGGSDITGYMVQSKYGDGEWMDVDPAHTGMEMMYMDTGLMPGITYYYQVLAVNAVGNSAWSDTTMSTTDAVAPGMPMNVMAAATSDTMITVTWEAPASNGGSDITGYMVQSKYGDGEWMDVDPAHTGMDMMYMDTGLMPGTTYYYQVLAVNAVGNSAWSDTTMATTEAVAPGMPMNVMAAATSDTMITVTWEAPASNGGSDITGYMVQSKYGDGEWMDVDPAHMGMDMMYMDTGLMPATMYYYRVRAMNAVDNGEWSDGMAMATTDAPASTELTKPVEVMAESNAVGELTLTWEDGDNADSYLLIAVNTADTSSYETVTVSNSAARMGTVTGLTSGADYLGIVVALQGTGADLLVEYGVSGTEAVQ